MEIGFASAGLGFVAGLLSTLSPCVLPLLPLVLGGALTAHRFGMLALTTGLVLAFVSVGMFVATIGFSIGLDAEVLRQVTAVGLLLAGLVLLSGALQQRFALATSGLGDAANRLIARIVPTGPSRLGGQFVLGVILGAVWSPCVGPTLGAASLLAAQGKDLGAAATVTAAFGAGTAVPLLLIGLLSRQALLRWRGRLMQAGGAVKLVFGATSIALAALILTGADKQLEAALVAASPAWLIRLSTGF